MKITLSNCFLMSGTYVGLRGQRKTLLCEIQHNTHNRFEYANTFYISESHNIHI